jgi:hypothetical protein
MGKNTEIRPYQTGGLHGLPLWGCNPSKWFSNKVLIWKIESFEYLLFLYFPLKINQFLARK